MSAPPKPVRLSEHFLLDELLHSRRGRKRPEIWAQQCSPADDVRRNLTDLCMATLEPLRELMGGHPIGVTSGYRCPDLNSLVGGSKRSAHMHGLAADIHLKPGWNHTDRAGELRERIRRQGPMPETASRNWMLWACAALGATSLRVNQVIYEYRRPRKGRGPREWVHIATAPWGTAARNEVLVIDDAGARRYDDLQSALRGEYA